MPPLLDYLALGHIAADLRPDGTAVLGGSVSYAATTAVRLGLSAGVVTKARAADAPELLAQSDPRVAWHLVDASATTTFRNDYDAAGNREQVLVDLAPPLSARDLPIEWSQTRILHLAPVVHETGEDVAEAVNAAFVGFTPQGWFRELKIGQPVMHRQWTLPPSLLDRVDAVVVSAEDLAGEGEPGALRRLADRVPVLVITRGSAGAMAYAGGQALGVPASTARAVDPTGAGDVFAAAFFIRYHETGDLPTALRFAAAAAACAVEGLGLEAIPDRVAVLRRIGESGRA